MMNKKIKKDLIPPIFLGVLVKISANYKLTLKFLIDQRSLVIRL